MSNVQVTDLSLASFVAEPAVWKRTIGQAGQVRVLDRFLLFEPSVKSLEQMISELTKADGVFTAPAKVKVVKASKPKKPPVAQPSDSV